MLRALFVLAALLCLGQSQAQTNTAIDLETREKVRSLYGLENDRGEIAILLQFPGRYLVLQFDQRLKLKGRSEFTLTKGYRYELLGAKYSAEHFTFYFETSRELRAIHSMAVSRTDFSVTPGFASLELQDSWDRWGHLFSGNDLMMLFIGRSNSQLKILKTNESGGFEERDFQLSNLDKTIIAEAKQTYKSFQDLDANHAIDTDKTVSLFESYTRKKLYNYEGTPVISIESYQGRFKTGFKIFDFESGEVQERVFSDTEIGAANRNSFLYDGKVFSVQYSDTEVYMTVRDFESKRQLSAYKSGTPTGQLLVPEKLKREGGLLFQKGQYSREKRILAKLSKEVGAIAVAIEGGDYLVTLGAYTQRQAGGSGGWFDANGVYIPEFYYDAGVGSTLFYNFTMDRSDLSLKAGIPQARVVDRVLSGVNSAGGDDVIKRSRGVIRWKGRNLVAYQGLKDRKLHLKILAF